jgi:uncharacterized membrane protein
MDFGGPDNRQRFMFPGQPEHHGGGHWVMWIIPAAFLVLFAATFVWFVVQQRGGRVIGTARPVRGGDDAALTELRLRYARGEVSREDFLAADADLRGVAIPPPPATA